MKPSIAKDTEEQLLLLRDLTKRLGILHDAQVFQLRMWPLVLFSHVVTAEAHVNIETHFIEYVFTKTSGRKPAQMKKRLDSLNEWTQWLLGEDWVVRVKEKGKYLYKGSRKYE